MSQYYNPVSLHVGAESVEALASVLTARHRDARRVLLLTRGGQAEQHEGLRGLMDALRGKEVVRKELQLANPDLTDMLALLKELGGFDFDLIVAVGGGSVLDAAKSLSAMHRMELHTIEALRSAVTEGMYREQERMTPWIGIPTTSGTGSEVTSWATLWDSELGCKYSVADERLYAEAALILPELTVSMPLRLSAVTGLDALCHAAEAYWAVRTNPISRGYALQAIERIRSSLPRLKDDPDDLGVRRQLSLGSLFAGLAFSNTKTTACHSISYPLTLQYGIEHGVAASLTLAEVLKINLAAVEDPEPLLRAFGAKDPDEVQRFLFELYRHYGIPSRLSQYGADAASIPAIADRAYTKGRMDNNPVTIEKERVEDILRSLL